MEQLTPREKRRARTSQAILDAALEIIAERGVQALAMREIAQRIEYSPSGLYEYYASKEEMLDALAAQGFEQLDKRIVRAQQGDLDTLMSLHNLASAYLNFAREQAPLYGLMFGHVTDPQQLVTSIGGLRRNATFSRLLTTVETGQANGELNTELSAEELAYSLWALMHGLAALRTTRLSQVAEIDALNLHVMDAAIEQARRH